MTYILAIKRHGEAVLFADTAVSVRKPERLVEMTALKTGRLFPGCLYGLAGHAEAGRQFVIDCTNRIIREGTLEEFWTAFNEFVQVYDYPEGRDFEAILCSRNSGAPRIFRYTPALGLVESEEMLSIGNGKKLLDAPLAEFLRHSGDKMIEGYGDLGVAPGMATGAILSIWLNQQSLGDEFSRFEASGVGGGFHFTAQSAADETRQPPGVFVLVRANAPESAINYWVYRVAFNGVALMVANLTESSIQISTDAAAWVSSEKLSQVELKECLQRIVDSSREPPIYEFWGIGMADSSQRVAMAYGFGRGDQVGWDGHIGPHFEQVIMQMLTGCAAPLKDGADTRYRGTIFKSASDLVPTRKEQ